MKTEIEIGGRYKIAENLILQRSRWIRSVTYVVLDIRHGVAFYEYKVNGSMHAGAENVAKLEEEWAEVNPVPQLSEVEKIGAVVIVGLSINDVLTGWGDE